MAPIIGRRSTASQSFIVAGISLTSIRKELKPALPTKKQEGSYLVVVTATDAAIKVTIAGAAVTLPAITSGSFVAELPYGQFKFILTDPFDARALFRCEFATGSFWFNGMLTKSPEILVRLGGGDIVAAAPVPPAALTVSSEPSGDPADASAMVNPFDATVGLPLLAAYTHIRKYGIQPFTASKTFAAQQVEVDNLLRRADRILRPVGISRADLECLLDRRVGLV